VYRRAEKFGFHSHMCNEHRTQAGNTTTAVCVGDQIISSQTNSIVQQGLDAAVVRAQQRHGILCRR